MAEKTNDKEIMEKRSGALKAVAEILSGKAGRKVFFGIWWCITVTALLWVGKVTEKTWLICTFTSCLLVGFGTIADTLVSDLGKKVVDIVGAIVGARVGAVVKKTEVKEETTNADAPAQ